MKPLKIKFPGAKKLNPKEYTVIQSATTDEESIAKIESNGFSTRYPVLITEQRDMIQAFAYAEDDETCIIPEPDPIVVISSGARA